MEITDEPAIILHPLMDEEGHPLTPPVMQLPQMQQQQPASTLSRAPTTGQPAPVGLDPALLALMQKMESSVSAMHSRLDKFEKEQAQKSKMSEPPLPSRIEHAGLPTGSAVSEMKIIQPRPGHAGSRMVLEYTPQHPQSHLAYNTALLRRQLEPEDPSCLLVFSQLDR